MRGVTRCSDEDVQEFYGVRPRKWEFPPEFRRAFIDALRLAQHPPERTPWDARDARVGSTSFRVYLAVGFHGHYYVGQTAQFDERMRRHQRAGASLRVVGWIEFSRRAEAWCVEERLKAAMRRRGFTVKDRPQEA